MPLGHPRAHRHPRELHRPQARQDGLHRVVGARGDPAGGDDEVGADELVLQGVHERALLVADRSGAVRHGAGVLGGGGEHVAVGVGDQPGRHRRTRAR